ncbi:MAG: hypothetical protein KDD70_06270 [Bdellovibrionales bacterium]|nr:hypothetical protein [Bdellovibrionales bacterium]
MTVGTGLNPERQADYQETPYEDAAWEIIDEVDENPQFAPMELEVLKNHEFQLDPMFEDYGGRTPEDQKRMFHAVQSQEEDTGETVEEKLRREIEELKASREGAVKMARKTALEQGRREGKEEAIQQRKQAEGMINEAVELLLKDMFNQLKQAVGELEKRSVEFSLQVARKIIGTAVEVNPEYVIPVIREALSHAGTALIKKVRVSPEDYEFIEVLGVRKVIQGFDGTWDFEADATITSGCVVDTTAGEIDFQLDEAWSRIADQVVRVVR